MLAWLPISPCHRTGLMVAAPIFAEMAKHKNPFRLIGIGIAIWTAAVVGCAMSFSFGSLAICRREPRHLLCDARRCP